MEFQKKMTRDDAELIIAFANCDMVASRAANKVYLHRNTLLYHFNRIKKATGLNPRCFYDLIDLVKMENSVLNDGCACTAKTK